MVGGVCLDGMVVSRVVVVGSRLLDLRYLILVLPAVDSMDVMLGVRLFVAGIAISLLAVRDTVTVVVSDLCLWDSMVAGIVLEQVSTHMVFVEVVIVIVVELARCTTAA